MSFELLKCFIWDKTFFGKDIFIFIPDIFWIFSLLLLLLYSLYISYDVKSLYLSRLIIELSVPIIIFSFFFLFSLKNLNLISLSTLKLDMFYIFFRFLFLFFFLFCLITSKNVFLNDKINLFEFPILLLLSAEGSFLMLLTDNLFTFYLALEVQNLCFYILASLKRYNNFSTEAGLKYFLLGAFSSSILLFGISLLYGLLGTLDLRIINILLNYDIFDDFNLLLLISFFFFISGLLFKFGSAPFHYWVPDVYEGSPTIVTMFFSIMPKLVLIFIFIKFYFFIFFFESRFFASFFFFCGFFSLFVGIFNAMFQLKLKRFLAYSAIANVGFILISFSTMNFDGFFSGLFYMFCYLFSVSLLFFFLLNFRKINMKELFFLFDLSLLNRENNIVFFILIFIFLSFAGIPPLIGFFGKFFIFFSLLNNFNYLVLFFVLIFSVISSFYYIRVIRFLFFTRISQFSFFVNDLNSYLFIFIFLFNIFFIFFFDFFGEFFYFVIIKSFFFL